MTTKIRSYNNKLNNDKHNNNIYIYILELENNKYYIGKTQNPDIRINQHNNLSGSRWTLKHKPVKILKVIPDCNNFDEDKYTIMYMEKYGINNVRGGSFCQDNINNDDKLVIIKMINSSMDKCYLCGKYGHFAKDCIDNENIPLEKNKKTLNIPVCYRCGRESHFSNNCYAKTNISGDIIEELEESDEELFCCKYCNKEFASLKGVTCHQNLYCNYRRPKNNINLEKLD